MESRLNKIKETVLPWIVNSQNPKFMQTKFHVLDLKDRGQSTFLLESHLNRRESYKVTFIEGEEEAKTEWQGVPSFLKKFVHGRVIEPNFNISDHLTSMLEDYKQELEQ